MKPTCPEHLSASALTPVRREIRLPAPDAVLPPQIVGGTPAEFDLPHGALWGTSPRLGLRVRCALGQLWITQAGIADDVVLLAGETFTPAPKGRVVIQALTDARVGLVGLT
jgi:hypothetical protein